MIDERIADRLAKNIRGLRERRGLTQQQISEVAGVPRATWATLESGVSNPTLAVLIKVADALQIRLEELIGPPQETAQHYPKESLPVRARGTAQIRRLLPAALPGLEIERMELPPGGHFTGVPHTPGTREYLTCERGALEVFVAGETFSLAVGDVVVFRGEERHSYRNPGRSPAVGYAVVAFAPLDRA